jgi:hypothetical protein
MKMGYRRWIALLREGHVLYRTADVMKLTELDYDSARRALLRLCDDGLLIKVGKELYGNGLCPPSLGQVAVALRRPSYVSMDSILDSGSSSGASRLSAVTLCRPGDHETPLGTIRYHKIARRLYWGFEMVPPGLAGAVREKALLDLLYMSAEDGPGWVVDHGLSLDGMDRGRLAEWASLYPMAVQVRLRRLVRSMG